jgi:oxalate decarboxylase/phosphoglucose isomerase-like protein (cupin superfamily)
MMFIGNKRRYVGCLAAATLLFVLTVTKPRAGSAQSAQVKDTTIQESDSPWEKFLRSEGIPVHRGFAIQDLMKAKVGPWKRYGANGAYVYLDGAGGVTTGFVLEIAPGQKTTPVRHMFESRVVVLAGDGEAHFWQDGGKKVTARYQAGTLFPFPLNVWYEIVNTGKEPARMYGVGWAPMAIDFYRDLDFVFNNKHSFTDRFDGRLDFFKPEPAEMKVSRHDGLGYAVSVTNLVPDVNTIKLYPAGHGLMETAWRQSGGSGTVNRHFSMAFDNLDSHVEQFQSAVYELGHRHGPGANVMYLGGHGYSLIWPPELGTTPFKDGHGDKVTRVEWGPNTVFVPPLNWFHQHFNPSQAPARFLKVAAFGNRVQMLSSRVVFQEYPVAIDYPAEDPEIKRIFEQECAKNGVKSNMPPVEKFIQLTKEDKEKKGHK